MTQLSFSQQLIELENHLSRIDKRIQELKHAKAQAATNLRLEKTAKSVLQEKRMTLIKEELGENQP
jgi:hypothetical protein